MLRTRSIQNIRWSPKLTTGYSRHVQQASRGLYFPRNVVSRKRPVAPIVDVAVLHGNVMEVVECREVVPFAAHHDHYRLKQADRVLNSQLCLRLLFVNLERLN